MMPCHFISRPRPGAMVWAKFSLTLVKVTKLSLFHELLQLRQQSWRPLCKHTYKVYILCVCCAGRCLTTNSGKKKSWFVALANFHGVNTPNHSQFHDLYDLTTLYLELERESTQSAFQYKLFPPV